MDVIVIVDVVVDVIVDVIVDVTWHYGTNGAALSLGF